MSATIKDISALSADILPAASRARPVIRDRIPWVPIFCANCGKDAILVPEASKDFAFYLCEPCGLTKLARDRATFRTKAK